MTLSRHAIRLVLAGLLVILGLWLLSQLTVATWLAQEADRREQDWSRGISPWRWDFADPASVVRSGSHGLTETDTTTDGLDLYIPADGVASLSLALHDDWLDPAALNRVRVELDSEMALDLMLISLQPTTTWLQQTLPAGHHAVELPLDPELVSPPIHSLLLRIESSPGARVQLQQLAWLGPACTTSESCKHRRTAAPHFITPEPLLAWRDQERARQPAVAVEAGGGFGTAGRWLARHLPPLSGPGLLMLALPPLGLLVFALARRLGIIRSRLHPRQTILPLVLGLGPAWVLLLAGWPERDTPVSIGLLLILGPLALACLPVPETPRWHWFGDRRAWSTALIFTLLAMAVTWPLHGLPRSTDTVPGLWPYPAWALVQQWLLLVVIMPRLRRRLPDIRSAALAGGLVFALLHAPNFGLMLFTFAGGTAWAWLGQRHRALLPLACSHAALGLWLLYVAPPLLLRSAEIGGRYLMLP